jgi:hypothetical protein
VLFLDNEDDAVGLAGKAEGQVEAFKDASQLCADLSLLRVAGERGYRKWASYL